METETMAYNTLHVVKARRKSWINVNLTLLIVMVFWCYFHVFNEFHLKITSQMCIPLSEHEVAFSCVVHLCSQSDFAVYLAKYEPNINHSHTKGTLGFGE